MSAIVWTFIPIEYQQPSPSSIIEPTSPLIEPSVYVETAANTTRSFGEYLGDKKSEVLSNVGEGITDSVTQSVGDVMKDFGLWLLQVLPDSFGVLAMVFCLGAIASIPKTGKWACISLILAIIFEILRRATL